jgi:hypothetical protein
MLMMMMRRSKTPSLRRKRRGPGGIEEDEYDLTMFLC